MKNLLTALLLAGILAACSDSKVSDEDLLWSYFSGFTYPPALFDSLKRAAASPETQDFLEGLKCFEKYSQFENLECYDSARQYFQLIRRRSPDSYLSYLGMGLLHTENAMAADSATAPIFATAAAYYDTALEKAPGHAAIYYYAARNVYNTNKSVFRRKVITWLDTATQIHPGFAKALERQAEYLSHYLDLESIGDADSVRFYFPNIEDQIKHYFSESLKYDSSWFQTYAGIARSYRVYSTRERLDFLKKGLAIARAQKSPETNRLAVSLADIYFYELSDFETTINAQESISDTEGSYSEVKDNFDNLAWANYYDGEIEKAESYFRKAIESTKGKKAAEAWLNMAQFQLFRFNFDKALEAVDRALRSDPSQSFRLRLFKARVLHEKGEHQLARQLLTELKTEGEQRWGVEAENQEEYLKVLSFLEAIG